MARLIVQAVKLNASPAELYAQYLNPRTHRAITGARAKIAAKKGANFSAFNGALTGRILQLVPKRLIVQSWRASHWNREDLDSTLILSFHAEGRGGRIELVHVSVPEHDYAAASEGWHQYYWIPWRSYLRK